MTVDVFAERMFEGNQLAVFPAAGDLPEALMPSIARKFRFSETAFVLPPERGGDARVRIFTLDGEAAFAGHPLVGTASVLADRLGRHTLRLEVPAGDAVVTVEADDERTRATVATPQPFTVDGTVPAASVERALGLGSGSVIQAAHEPTACGMGRAFVVAAVSADALDAAVPRLDAFADAREAAGFDRFAVLAYAHDGDDVRTRMFSPLTGTTEDPATGSANVALAGLLLHLQPGRSELRLVSRQGVQMGRPSTLHLHAWRADDEIQASVGGAVVPVTRGWLDL